ncbi:MAG: GntP family permease [Oscillospiraceae bacterium]|jgi:H+/gluconate symporter-like permease
MLGVIGIVVALALLIFLIFKGWHMGVVALISSLVIVLTSKMDVWPAFAESFAVSFKNFAGTWFLMFTLGAIFGKIMEDSGASVSIANTIVRAVGKKRVILIVLLTTLVLSYGGIGVFIIAFTMYPICMALFKEADLPKSIFPGLLLAIPATITMSFAPGVPAVQNMIPTETFGTTIYAAPVIGTVTSIAIFVMDYAFYTWAAKRCAARGEHFVAGPDDHIIDLNDAEAVKNLPSPLASFLPIIVLIVSIFVFMKLVSVSNYAVVLGMVLAIVLALILFRGRLKVRDAMGAGMNSGLNALMVTSMIMGFGGVVKGFPRLPVLCELAAGPPNEPHPDGLLLHQRDLHDHRLLLRWPEYFSGHLGRLHALHRHQSSDPAPTVLRGFCRPGRHAPRLRCGPGQLRGQD